jgi:hypothetical protein
MTVSGSIPHGSGDDIGRFGWRGQISTLQDFMLTACANELGLQVAEHPQAQNPLDPEYRLEGKDLSRFQCDDLLVFLELPPAPQPVLSRRTG